ncbi:hypothetical protein ACPA9J_23485 [Pseudomonas aeruginosa]
MAAPRRPEPRAHPATAGEGQTPLPGAQLRGLRLGRSHTGLSPLNPTAAQATVLPPNWAKHRA